MTQPNTSILTEVKLLNQSNKNRLPNVGKMLSKCNKYANNQWHTDGQTEIIFHWNSSVGPELYVKPCLSVGRFFVRFGLDAHILNSENLFDFLHRNWNHNFELNMKTKLAPSGNHKYLINERIYWKMSHFWFSFGRWNTSCVWYHC